MSAEAIAGPDVGDIVGEGRFELGRKLGEGGMSNVFVASDRFLDRDVALKLLIPRYLGRPEREQRFLNEAEYLRRVQEHVHVTRVIDSGRLRDRDQWPWLSTEIIHGQTLDWWKIHRSLDIHQTLEIARQLAEALRACHEAGIVHRDLTPNNVFVLDDGSVKLFDFSHAADLRGPQLAVGAPQRLTRIYETPGTVGYIAPEQAVNAAPAASMDAFSYGVVLYEAVSGSHPFKQFTDRDAFIQAQMDGTLQSPRLQAWAYDAPEELAELVRDCMQRDGSKRPTMSEVLERLEGIIALMRPAAAPSEDVTVTMDAPAMVAAQRAKQTADAAAIGAWTRPREAAAVASFEQGLAEDRTVVMPAVAKRLAQADGDPDEVTVAMPVVAARHRLAESDEVTEDVPAVAKPRPTWEAPRVAPVAPPVAPVAPRVAPVVPSAAPVAPLVTPVAQAPVAGVIARPESAAARGLPSPGTIIAGHIVLGEKHARGGMSVVHFGYDQTTEGILAVKLLTEGYKGQSELEQRLLNEGLCLEELGPSPLLVELVEHGRIAECDGWPYVATKLMRGLSVDALISRQRDMSLVEACDVAHQLALAVQLVHRHGIVHRDITPANVYLSDHGFDEPTQVKLFDFSHAGRLDGPRGARGSAGRFTGAHEIPGTHGFMSPEQASGKPATAEMDVFAFGATLFELLTRKPLFEINDRNEYILLARGGNLPTVGLEAGVVEFETEPLRGDWDNPGVRKYEIPEALAELVNACVNLRAEARPSMDEVVERLAAIGASLATAEEQRDEQPEGSGGVELAFARPPELRGPAPVLPAADVVDPVVPEPVAAGEDDVEIGDEDPEPIASGRGWLWGLGGGLAIVLGLAVWLWMGRDDGARDQAVDDGSESVEAAPIPADVGPGSDETTETGEGPHYETVPEVEVEVGTTGDEVAPKPKPKIKKKIQPKIKPKIDDEPKPDVAVSPECEDIEQKAKSEAKKRHWKTVLEHTSRTKCWSSGQSRKRLEVAAYANLGRWSDCIKVGDGSKDAMIQQFVADCKDSL